MCVRPPVCLHVFCWCGGLSGSVVRCVVVLVVFVGSFFRWLVRALTGALELETAGAIRQPPQNQPLRSPAEAMVYAREQR